MNMWYRRAMIEWGEAYGETLEKLLPILHNLKVTGLTGSSLRSLAHRMLQDEWDGIAFNTYYTLMVYEEQASEIIEKAFDSNYSDEQIAKELFDKGAFQISLKDDWDIAEERERYDNENPIQE